MLTQLALLILLSQSPTVPPIELTNRQTPAAGTADGNLWRKMTANDRAFYGYGFLHGARHVAVMLLLDAPLSNDERGKAVTALRSATEKISEEQFVDGLNTFFDDFRNRNISIVDSAAVVLLQIKGKPQPEIDRLVQALRASAKH